MWRFLRLGVQGSSCHESSTHIRLLGLSTSNQDCEDFSNDEIKGRWRERNELIDSNLAGQAYKKYSNRYHNSFKIVKNKNEFDIRRFLNKGILPKNVKQKSNITASHLNSPSFENSEQEINITYSDKNYADKSAENFGKHKNGNELQTEIPTIEYLSQIRIKDNTSKINTEKSYVTQIDSDEIPTTKVSTYKNFEEVKTNDDSDTFGTLSKHTRVFELQRDDVEDLPNPLKEKFGKRLDAHSYGRKILALCRDRKLKEGLEVLELEMKVQGVAPDVYCLNILINACGKAGYAEKAFSLYNELKKRKLPVEKHALTGLFNACANSPQSPSDRLVLIERLRKTLKDSNTLLHPITYHAMIKAYGRCGALESALDVADEMLENKHLITTETMNFLLQACISCKEEGFRHSLMVWRRMRKLSLKPSIHSYNLLLRSVKECQAGDPKFLPFLLGDLEEEGSLKSGKKMKKYKRMFSKSIDPEISVASLGKVDLPGKNLDERPILNLEATQQSFAHSNNIKELEKEIFNGTADALDKCNNENNVIHDFSINSQNLNTAVNGNELRGQIGLENLDKNLDQIQASVNTVKSSSSTAQYQTSNLKRSEILDSINNRSQCLDLDEDSRIVSSDLNSSSIKENHLKHFSSNDPDLGVDSSNETIVRRANSNGTNSSLSSRNVPNVALHINLSGSQNKFANPSQPECITKDAESTDSVLNFSQEIFETQFENHLSAGDCLPNLLGKHIDLKSNLVSISSLEKKEHRLALLGGFAGILSSMDLDGVTPNAATFTAMLESAPQSKQIEDVLLKYMKKYNIAPDIIFCNMLIRRRCISRSLEEAKEALDLMRDHRLHPDLITFGCLAVGCKKPGEVRELLRDMDKASFTPSEEIFSTLMRNCLRNREYLLSLDLLQRMRGLDIEPSEDCLQMLENGRKAIRKRLIDQESSPVQNSKMSQRQLRKNEEMQVFLLEYIKWLKGSTVSQKEHPWAQYGYSRRPKALSTS